MREALTKYISEELLGGRRGPIGPEDDLLTGGLVDSLGIMSLIFFIEETFSIEVPAEDVTIDNFLTINTIERYLVSRRS